jgi:hypothetical protein
LDEKEKKNKQNPISTEIYKREWKWIGHTLIDLLAVSQKQHWNGIHRESGKEDALEQHDNGSAE